MLDERIEAIRQQYGLDKADFWELPQKKGTWLVKHSALEVVAAKAGIHFDQPQIIESNTAEGIAVVCVYGGMRDRPLGQWSIGEASPKNNKNAYPWAMAEKRAKDRVILKLVGIHGLVYSEDEMSEPVQAPEPQTLPKAKARNLEQEMRDEMNACQTAEDLDLLVKSKPFQTELKKMPPDWQDGLREHYAELMAEMRKKQTGYVEPDFTKLEQA